MPQIKVSDHQINYGKNISEHGIVKEAIARTLESVIRVDMERIDVFHLRGVAHNHTAGTQQRLVVFINGVLENGNYEAEGVEEDELYGYTIKNKTFIKPVGSDDSVLIEVNGVIIAEYYKSRNELCILFNLFNDLDENPHDLKIFYEIMKDFQRLVLDKREMRYSWIHSEEKDQLTKRFIDRFKEQRERQLREDRNRINDYEHQIEEYKRMIKQRYDTLLQLRRNVVNEMANLADVETKLIADLDLIAKHPKVSDLQIKNGKFIVYTPNIYAYSSEGKRYYIGNMRTEIKLEEIRVEFFGDNPRQGFWGNDPHPHVKGSTGKPCLGSVGATIAELASRNEIYALVLTCIDFLENANTSDPAGTKVVMWDEVDENGTIIRTGGAQSDITWTCDHCGEGQPEDNEGHTVYMEGYLDVDGDPVLVDERYVCGDCLGAYTWYEELGAYVNERLDDENNDEEEDDEDEF